MTADLTDTLSKMKEMKMGNLALKLSDMVQDANFDLRKADEVIIELIRYEYESRHSRKMRRLLNKANMKYPSACIDDSIDDPTRKLDTNTVRSLASCGWIREKKNLIITGKAGTGKTNMACALGGCAIQNGMSVRYVKASLMINDLCEYQLTGNYKDYLKKYTDPDLLIIDDFGLMSLDISRCLHLFEVLDAREGSGSVLVISQIPVSKWYDTFQNSLYADACMSRMTHSSYRLEMNGRDMRRDG